MVTQERAGARAYTAWAIALLAYAVAVFHRSSLGVAAVDAQERFSAGASAVSLFLVLQLAVYAALQVPVGVALDRFGSRRMILAGALTMAAGQLVLAVATAGADEDDFITFHPAASLSAAPASRTAASREFRTW